MPFWGYYFFYSLTAIANEDNQEREKACQTIDFSKAKQVSFQDNIPSERGIWSTFLIAIRCLRLRKQLN